MKKNFQNFGFSIALACVFLTVFWSNPPSFGAVYASFNDQTIASQDSVKIEFRKDPTKYISQKSKPYLQTIGNLVVVILLLLTVIVIVLAWLGGKHFKYINNVILTKENRIIKFIERDEIGNGKEPVQKAELLCKHTLVVIDELQRDGTLKPYDAFLLDLYQITQKNLDHSAQHYLVTDFPTMIEKDLDRLLIGYNPFERWVSFITLIAPSLGFFGTVLGMMDVANVFAKIGSSPELNILPGLGIALVTTALGLILLFISSFIDHYFEYKNEKLRKKIMTFLSRINVYLFLTPTKVEK
jgi:biopolymer transport protein ExbB